jgi:hypothetical protein
MAPKPRQAPRDVPDSLPTHDQGTDVSPDAVRQTEQSRREPPDSLPADDEENVERERL